MNGRSCLSTKHFSKTNVTIDPFNTSVLAGCDSLLCSRTKQSENVRESQLIIGPCNLQVLSIVTNDCTRSLINI